MKKTDDQEIAKLFPKEGDRENLNQLNLILTLELQCSEAIGIRKNEPSEILKGQWGRALQAHLPNLYDSLPTVFKTLGNSSTTGQLNGLSSKGIRSALLGSGDMLPFGFDSLQAPAPFVVHWLTPSGKLFPTLSCFRFVPRNAQQAIDLTLIAHYLAEKSLCPGLVVYDLEEIFYQDFGSAEKDRIDLPDLDKMLAFLGLPHDSIETPTDFQKELFGERRRRIPDDPWTFSGKETQLFADIPGLCTNAFEKFAKITGRSYDFVDQVQAKEADTVIVAAGRNFTWISENLSRITKSIEPGIGVVHPTVMSPFPEHLLSHILKGKQRVVAVSNHDNPDHDPLVQAIRTAFDRAIENGLAGKKSELPHPFHAVYDKIADRPRLITFSVDGGQIDFKSFEKAVKSIDRDGSTTWQFHITGKSVGREDKGPDREKAETQKESAAPDLPVKEETEAPAEEAPISSGDNFRQLLSYFITGKAPHPDLERYIGLKLKPVFFSKRKDAPGNGYPICLVQDSSEKFVKSLPQIFDEIVNEEGQNEEGREDLQKDLSTLEARMESLVNGKEAGRLSELWDRATKSMLADIQAEDEKEAVQKNLQKARGKLKIDGQVLPLDVDLPDRIVEESLSAVWAEKTASFRDQLNQTIARLYELIGLDPSGQSDTRESEDFAESVPSAFRDELDYESFSQLVEESFERQPLPKNRRSRIQEVIRSLKALQPLYSLSGDGKPSLARFQFHLNDSNVAETIGEIQARIHTIIKFFRALHLAKLEVENKYSEEKHGRFFAEYSVTHLSAEDLEAAPPILLHVSSAGLDETNLAALMDLLSTDLPVKVILKTDDVLDQSDLLPHQVAWSTQFAAMAIGLNNVFVYQSALADGQQFAQRVLRGLKYSGPAFFNIYIPSREDYHGIGIKELSLAAVESRAFPTVLYDPQISQDWGSRFSIRDNPQYEKDWMTKAVSYQDAEGKDASVELTFTLVDFLAADSRFAAQFLYVPHSRWHDNMIPLHDYLKLKQEEAKYKLPYLQMTTQDGTLHRVIPTRFMVGLALSWREGWRSLQELGLYKEEKARLEEERKKEIESVEEKYKKEQGKSEQELKREIISNLLTRLLSGDLKAPQEAAAPPTGAAQAPTETAEVAEKTGEAAEVEEEKEEAAEITEPYIDTPLCTSCNECTNINNRMFAYNENKQAYIKDANAGTYKELVKAAEKCPARIIHPGKPKNPNEPGLDKLIKRAEPFNKV